MSKRIVDSPELHGWVDLGDDKWGWDGVSGGTGAGMIISETEPDAVDGTQWLNALTGEVFIYDDGKWLEFPGGKDGAAGADGNIADGSTDGVVATWDSTAGDDGAGQWTPDSSLIINPSGNATFSERVHIGDRSAQEPLDVAAENTATVWNDGATRYRMARFENSATLAASGVRTGMNFWHDNNKGVVLQSAANGGSLSFGVRGGATDNVAMTIDSTGDATFSGTVNAGVAALNYSNPDAPLCVGTNAGQPIAARFGSLSDPGDDVYIRIQGKDTGGTNKYFDIRHIVDDGALTINGPQSSLSEIFRISTGGDATFSGTVSDGSGPLMSTRGLINTLSTLRQATMDDTQDIRESLRSAIDELVEGFEQQISTMEESE